MSQPSIRVVLLLCLALVSVSTSSIFVRLLPIIPAVVIAFWRMATASCFLWSYSAIKPQGVVQKSLYVKILIAGVFLGLHFACFFGALKLTSVANATLFGTTAPFFTVLIEKIYYKQDLQRKVVFGLILAATGGVIIHGGHFELSDQHTQGILLALLGSLWLAFVWLLTSAIRQSTKTVVFGRSLYMVAAVLLFVFAAVLGQSVFEFSARDIPWFIALGLIPTVFGHTVFSYTMKYVSSATIVASVPLGEPVLASVLAWMLFAETVPVQTMIGGIFTLTGVFLITVRSSSGRFQPENL